MGINYCTIFFKLFFLYFATFPSFVDCFKIVKCGSNKLLPSVIINNKSVVQFDSNTSPIKINQTDQIELWCESDCWFSECKLTHVPNTQFGCGTETEDYEQIVTEKEAVERFGDSKGRHECKFILNKTFDCSGNAMS